MVLVEGRCCLIFGIDHHGVGGDFGLACAGKGIAQHGGTKALPLVYLRHRQSPHAHRGNGGVTRQLFGQGSGQITQPDAAGGQRVVGGNLPLCGTRDKAACYTAAHILADLLMQVLVQRWRAAMKGGALVLRRQSFNLEGADAHEPALTTQ